MTISRPGTRNAVWRARCSSSVEVERGILREDLTVRPVADPRAGDTLGRAPRRRAAPMRSRTARRRNRAVPFGESPRLAAVERHRPRLAAAVDLDVEALRKRVDDRCAHAVQSARRGVRAAAELAARMQLREDDLDARQPGARLDVDGDAARAVAHLDAAVGVQDDVDAGAVAAEGLVDGVVDDLPQAVHQAARVGRADVHARTLADRLEPFEHLKMMGGVLGGHNPQGYPPGRTARAIRHASRHCARTRSAKCAPLPGILPCRRGCIS